ncbi:MAG: hypothetical protein RR330_05305 [Alistipes sp.]
MLGFTPFKRHANAFKYHPRYYDPAKEAREERRAELHGERSDDDREYTPGQYLRTQHAARARRFEEESKYGRRKMWSMAIGLVLILLFVALLFPRLVAVFQLANRTPQAQVQTQQEAEIEAFDPYAPIRIVPNDYKEE